LGNGTSVRIVYPPDNGASRTADDQTIVAQALVRDFGEDITATDAFLRAMRPRVVILKLNLADPFRDGSDEPALRTRLAASGAEIFDR